MNWNYWYRINSYLRSSLWVVPFIAIPLELALTRLLHRLDGWLGWTLLGYAVPGAQALLQTIITAMLTFLVFTFGSLLVAVQIASGQLTPRIIATTLLRDGTVKYIVGLFIFTLFFSVSALDRMEKEVSQLVVLMAACLAVLCFAAFLYLIDYAARMLRPVSVLSRLGDAGIAVIDNVYPESSFGPSQVAAPMHELAAPARTFYHRQSSGIVLAVNIAVLLEVAQKTGGVIEFVPQVGDFVASESPLFNLYGGAEAADEDMLSEAVIFGSERTIEQDPTFALRIVVDIALRALSPAINDPTTAVLAIDQLHRLLRRVGQRHLRTDRILDGDGNLRVIFKTPDWEDFVALSFSEIRSCGSANLQIVRRLRAMIDNLLETLPEHRRPRLREQLSLLDREMESKFVHREELALARVADSQGLGGRSGHGRISL
jgi:uncharacterized membrane protein